jgi:hypothetical protein
LSSGERQWRDDDLMSIRKILGDELYRRLWDESYGLTAEEVVRSIE